MAPKKLSKPKGAYSKVGGVAGTKFTGSSKMDKLQNFIVSTDETTETRKERFENPSRLYAAARKLGIPQKSIKKQVDDMAKYQAKYGAAGERKSEDLSMQDMMRRSKANAAKKKATVKKAAATSPKARGAKKASELREPFRPAQPPRRRADAPKAKKATPSGKVKPMSGPKKLTPKKK
jgi:hypothetical protein